MAYEALYTRARPKNLDQLVGQEHISNSLARALNQDRLSHAYLLVGTRGTGKTSTARILAKAINCDTVHDANGSKKTLPKNSIPCNECEACRSFKSSPDNVEFDAASNRSVEDVSRLLSTAYLAPLQSRYKTFIIDEVHMLSFEAVNSILKLIEEPPPNVIFFLATTEFNKVPQTIRSRCQILNFKLIPQEVIADHLISLAKGLNFSAEAAAVRKIARLAKGSMRDALTLFDQCYSMTDSDLLTVDIVDNTLGLVSDSDLDEIVEAAKSRDRRKIIESTAKAFKSGLTANIIAESIITRLRDIVSNIKDSRSSELAIYNEMIDQLRKSIIEMQGSGIPEVILETALFKFASNPIVRTIPVYENSTEFEDYPVVSEVPDIKPAPVPETPNKPHLDKKDEFVNESSFQSDEGIPGGNHNDQSHMDELDSNFAVSDEEYMESLVNIEDYGEKNATEFEEPDRVDKSINKSEKAVISEDKAKSEESKADMVELLMEKLEQNGENEIIDCMKLAKVVKYESGAFLFKFGSTMISEMFQSYINSLEAFTKEWFGKYYKFRLIIEENSTAKLIQKEDIFSKIANDEREYLFNIMQLLHVSKNEVRLLSNDGIN